MLEGTLAGKHGSRVVELVTSQLRSGLSDTPPPWWEKKHVGNCFKIVWAGYENVVLNVDFAHVVRMMFLGG